MYRVKPWLALFTDEAQGGSTEEQVTETETESPDAPTEDSEDEYDDEDSGEWDRERALSKIRKTNAENKRLRERSKKAEEESKKLPDLEARNRELESRLLRMEVAAELGIPKSIADRLNGGTREEVLADAEELLALIGPAAPKQRKPINGFGESHSNEAAPVKPISLDELAAGFMRD